MLQEAQTGVWGWMGKLPWFKFFPGDWMKDPELRSVTSGARGLWIDMLNLMFESVRRGHLSLQNGNAVTAELLAHMTGNSTDDVSRWLQELEYSGVFSRTDTGVIFSRRLVRDERERSGIRERVAKHRSNAHVTGDVTASSDSDSEFTDFDVGLKERKEARRKSDQELETAVKSGSDELIERIVRLHPANWREKGILQVPHAQAVAIIAAISRDGPELVEQGTGNYGVAVGKWPMDERKFVLNPVKFWAESHYLHNPELWERSNGKPSKTEERVNKNRAAILAGLGISQEPRHGKPSVQDGTHAGRSPGMAKLASGRAVGNG